MIKPALLTLLLAAAPVAAQPSPGPQPAPLPPAIEAPRDIAFPGVITLAADATHLTHRIVRVRETIPVQPGARATLLYPKWVPGGHNPRNPLKLIAGLRVTGGGAPLAWTRDPVEVYALYVDVPAGVGAIELAFDYVSPLEPAQGQVMFAPTLLEQKWLQTVFYPAGYYARRIAVDAQLAIPAGWEHATALTTTSATGGVLKFARTDLETLVDSPVLAGKHLKKVELSGGARSSVTLAMAADLPRDLEPKPEHIEKHRALVRQADLLFGARHFDRYTFLLWQSDTLGGDGLEHHRSSENGIEPGLFREWDNKQGDRDLLPHEYTHSWNGKFRRPADLWTPEYLSPMRDSLLWVYEGQTQFWGQVLAARSGMWSKQEALDELALTAANFAESTPGRAWKALADTTNDPIVTSRSPLPWRNYQRREDYYEEGKLIWLEADTLIREATGGKRSLDDFARAFFGGADGSWTPVTYTLDDVAAALNAVHPMDWGAWLRARVNEPGRPAPNDWIARGGYRLVFTDEPTKTLKGYETSAKSLNLAFGPGFTVGRDGRVGQVVWDGPAFKAGIIPGMKLIAVGGRAFDGDELRDAVKATKTGGALAMVVQNGGEVRTLTIAYAGGLRYPRLERVTGTPDRLGALLAPRAR